MRRLLSTVAAAALLSLAGCHHCDVCDDCGDGAGTGGCKRGCGSRSHHAKVYGDQGYAPGYVAPVMEAKATPVAPPAVTVTPVTPATPVAAPAKTAGRRVSVFR
ncbi:MAG TPA: hypothetical protein VNC50_22810 [Planctomycetia bacterium]|jgi:hypothetical protein|nr:hypothetical protein [Planctomycetia bacterium]